LPDPKHDYAKHDEGRQNRTECLEKGTRSNRDDQDDDPADGREGRKIPIGLIHGATCWDRTVDMHSTASPRPLPMTNPSVLVRIGFAACSDETSLPFTIRRRSPFLQ
jgi:hypothetical protein